MAALIDRKEWSTTRLGPRDRWPPALSFTVRMILSSGFPMAVRWGPEFVMIYNDGYRPILGEKHPWALGLPFAATWPEVQSDLRGLHDAILAGENKGFFAEDFPLRIQRHGSRWEDAKFTLSYGPIPDDMAPTGVGGVLVTVVETTSRVEAEEALRASEAALRESELNLRLIHDSTTDAIYCVGPTGLTTRCNAAFLRVVGFERESDALGNSLHDVIHHTRPDGTPYPKADCPIYRCAIDGVPAHIENECFYRLDGTSFPVEYWVAPIVRDGALQGSVCTFIDITERKQALDRQSMLLRELHHRVKNVFALTGAIVRLSARSAKSQQELAQNIRGRLDALSMAHTLILPHSNDPKNEKQSILLHELLGTIFLPFASADTAATSRRCICEGPAIRLGSQTVTSLALVLHEFATNSAKYGALSLPDGSVWATWTNENEKLRFRWEERAGPPIMSPPVTNGFGTLLATNGIQDDFGGRINYSWNPDGLVIEFEIEAERLRR